MDQGLTHSEKIFMWTLGALFLIPVVLSIISLGVSSTIESSSVTPAQVTYLESLQDNLVINEIGCVQASCFTDQSLSLLGIRTQFLEDALQSIRPGQTSTLSVIDCNEINFGASTSLTESLLSIGESSLSSELLSIGSLIISENAIECPLLSFIGSIQIDETFKLGYYTTSERLALIASNGMMVYDTDLDSIYAYQGNTWVSSGVTSVNGTVNQIDSTGGANPILSLSSTILNDIDSKFPSAGGTITGALISTFVGSASNPNFSINGSSGIYLPSAETLGFTTDNTLRMTVGSNITIIGFGTGIVHSTLDVISSSLIINADITDNTINEAKLAGSIPDSKLSTISSSGKVSNSATTATSDNTASAIVARDGNGDFIATEITLTTLSGPINSRSVDDILSCSTAQTTDNLVSFSSTSKVVQDSGLALSNVVLNTGGTVTSGHLVQFSGTTGRLIVSAGAALSAYLPLAGGTMSGNINMASGQINNCLAYRCPDTNFTGGLSATIPSGTHNVVIGNSATCSAVNDNVVLGSSASAQGSGNVIIGRSAVGALGSDNSVLIGNGATCSNDTNTVIGNLSSATGGTSNVFGKGNTSSAANADIFGFDVSNSTANSLLLGNGSYVNIRANTSCDLGTTSIPFQTLWAQGVDRSSAALAIGGASASSLALGRSGITTTILGTFSTSSTYMPGGSVPTNIASSGVTWVDSASTNLMYSYNSITYPIAGNNNEVSGRFDASAAGTTFWTDGTISLNWDQTNQQPRFQIPSGTTWQGAAGVLLESRFQHGGAEAISGAAVTPLVATTNYYLGAAAASGARVAGMDMTSAVNIGTYQAMPNTGTTSTIYWLSIMIMTNGSNIASWNVRKMYAP